MGTITILAIIAGGVALGGFVLTAITNEQGWLAVTLFILFGLGISMMVVDINRSDAEVDRHDKFVEKVCYPYLVTNRNVDYSKEKSTSTFDCGDDGKLRYVVGTKLRP